MVAAAYFAALAALRTDAAHMLRQKLLAESAGCATVLEASEDCQKLLNVLVEVVRSLIPVRQPGGAGTAVTQSLEPSSP